MARLTTPITRRGAFVDLSIGISLERENALRKRNRAIPPRIIGKALIDTGASRTSIDAEVLKALQLAPTGAGLVHTGSTAGKAHPCNLFDVSLIIPSSERDFVRSTVVVMEINLSRQGQSFSALVGRDILDSCVLVYDGPGQIAMLEFRS